MDRYSWKCDRCGVERHSQYVIQCEVDVVDKEYADAIVARNAEIIANQIKINKDYEKEKDIARLSVETYNKSHILKKEFVECRSRDYVIREGYRIDTAFYHGAEVYRGICKYTTGIPETRHIKCDSCGYRQYL